ncbi:MAG TPA: hypothetical protein VH165_05450 [Kofleriaceae bacterium]|jgi:hypothetical protein|nr:hypothetical protein [Kofleriaceae bacterium]
MDVQQNQLTYDDLEIVGSTIVPEPGDLPRRLSPIYRHRAAPTWFLLPRAEEADAPPPMAREDQHGIEALVAAGDAVLFDYAIAARPRHWLVQFASQVRPEYLPVVDAPVRLRYAARQALERAATELDRHDRSAALREAWYARRADPNDPLPLLVIIALLPAGTLPDEIAIVQQDLAELHTRESIGLAHERARHEAALSSMAALLSGELSYLNGFRTRTGFLVESRSWYRSPTQHRALPPWL